MPRPKHFKSLKYEKYGTSDRTSFVVSCAVGYWHTDFDRMHIFKNLDLNDLIILCDFKCNVDLV